MAALTVSRLPRFYEFPRLNLHVQVDDGLHLCWRHYLMDLYWRSTPLVPRVSFSVIPEDWR